MLEFTLLGYGLCRSSFKLRVARVVLSLTKRHRQLCLHRPLSGPELSVVSGRGDYESDHFRQHAQHSPQFQPPLLYTTFSSGPDKGLRRHS